MAGGRSTRGAIDWSRVDIRTLELFQPPGPGNVLGRVKFVFPNKHDVYMHDTPQKFLFANAVRAESHGCMRVQNPDQLAAVLLKQDQNWSQARTLSAIENGYDQQVGLRQRSPSTSPTSRLRLMMTVQSQPTGTYTVTMPAWRPRSSCSAVKNLGKSC